ESPATGERLGRHTRRHPVRAGWNTDHGFARTAGRSRPPVDRREDSVRRIDRVILATRPATFRRTYGLGQGQVPVAGAAARLVLGDALGSVGVIAAAVVLLTTGWPYADTVRSEERRVGNDSRL